MFRRRRREDGTSASEATDETYQAPDLAEWDEDDADPDDSLDYGAEDYAEPGYDSPAGDAGDDDADDGGARSADEPAASRAEREDLSDPATWTRLRDTQAAVPAMARTAGPWDSAGEYPDQPRIDFGSLLVPVRDGYDIQVLMSEEEGVSIAVVRGDSGLQLQPFAAPRSSGLWHEVLPEIAQEVANVGGQSAEQHGPFGPELLARVAPQGAGNQPVPPQPLRFIGVDGPRWFLRGLISGPAAIDDEQAQLFRDILADVVVVRGEQAQPPRQALQIQLPEEARQALEDQAAEQPNPLNPFERGPEITETR
ncbi:MAG: DUF3710 domain-containing protein [Streptosporangiaceae bacterium]